MGAVRYARPSLIRPFNLNIRHRRYASFGDRITLTASHVAQSAQHIVFSTSLDLQIDGRWGLRKNFKQDDEQQAAQLVEAEQKCKAELPAMLSMLSILGNIKDIRLTMSDVLDLPIRHDIDRVNQPELHKQDARVPRTPVSVLSKIGLNTVCKDVCLWTLQEFPKIRIEDTDVRAAVLKARQFPDRDSWRQSVADSKDPVLQAYDFTADFHRRDMTATDNFGGKKSWIDVMPLGEGYMWLPGVDLDDFSCELLAPDFHNNVEFLSSSDGEGYWIPGLYERLRETQPVVYSALKNTGRDEVVTLQFDRPSWQIPESIRNKLLASLPLKEGEEYVWGESSVSKRKKIVQGDGDVGGT